MFIYQVINMTTESTKKRKGILADIDLDVYIGEQHVFVRVCAPDEEGISNWPSIQKFYRWVAANGMDENEVWRDKLGYAKIPLRWFKSLREDFSTRVIERKAFFAE